MNTSPTPTEIAKPCPNSDCSHACKLNNSVSARLYPPGTVTMYFVECDDSCGYRGPFADTEAGAIRLHNALCAPALAPFEKLAEELRAEAEQTRTHHGGGTFRLTGRQRPTWSELSDEGELLLKCADRLSAVVEEVRGKQG